MLLALTTGTVAAQEPARTPAPAGIPSQSARIYFSALDKQERPVLGLTEKDFELKVNGKRVPMESFRAARPLSDRSMPLVAWILLDFNPNVKKAVILNQGNAVAAAFDIFHPESALGVKFVSSQSETLAPLAHDPAALRSAFDHYDEGQFELRVGRGVDAVDVGEMGIARALEFAIGEIDEFVDRQPSLRGREVHRAVIIISEANLNPSYKLKPLYARAASSACFFYPVFVPTRGYGPWVRDYFLLAEKTAGVAAFFGAIAPGSEIWSPPRNNHAPNALTVNFMHVARDLNGKYSFALPLPASGQTKLKLSTKAKGVKIRLPRTVLP
jgi:hypothetical protein